MNSGGLSTVTPVAAGPARLLSSDPLIIATGCDGPRPFGLVEPLGSRCPDRPIVFLVALHWTCEDAAKVTEKVEIARRYRARVPKHEVIFLCNTQRELTLFKDAGADAFLANYNLFLSDDVFRPVPETKVEFDAVYNARPHVDKRHELAEEVGSVAYIAGVSEAQEAYHPREIVARILARPGHVLLNSFVGGFPRRMDPHEVNESLARAAVGLCLSEAEGTMLASMEYLLAGLPVVSTPSRGGRDAFFDPDYCVVADPDPRAIREAVDTLRARAIPREYVRERTMAMLRPERLRFLAFFESIKERCGVARSYRTNWTFSYSPVQKWRTVEEHANEIFGCC